MFQPMRANWPIGLDRREVDHVLVIVSDIEVGSGGPTDDFPQSAFLGDLLLSYCEPPFDEVEVTLVFNGDTFDFLKTPLRDGTYPIHVTQDAALEKADRIFGAHGSFLDSIAQFGAFSGAPRNLRFIVGNHDTELFFPGVQTALRERIGEFIMDGLAVDIGDVHIEHGHQDDPMFRMRPDAPLIEFEGTQVLNLPWGSLALLEVAMPLHPQLFPFDRIRPRNAPLAQLPEVRELLLAAYWDYWTEQYWQGREHDPLHRVSWTMLKQILYRFGSKNPDVPKLDPHRVDHGDGQRLHVVGHRHVPAWWEHGGHRILQLGCFRNEFLFDPECTRELLPNVYVEAYLHGGKTRRSHLVEVDSPPPPQSPGNLDRLLPMIRELLEAQPNTAHHQTSQSDREKAGRFGGLAPPSFVRTLRETLRKRVISR